MVFCAEGVSSIDRAAEGPSKVLFESPCANLAHDVTPQTQWKMAGCCPCFTGMSCYWSSAATQNPDSDEWILLRLKAPVCLVTEMEISPYKCAPRSSPETCTPARCALGGLAHALKSLPFFLLFFLSTILLPLLGP